MKLTVKLLAIILSLLMLSTIFAQPESIESICGDDDRGLSNNRAVGRIWSEGLSFPKGTAFIISNGKLITAGHVARTITIVAGKFFVEFQVPGNNTQGNPQPAAPENRYEINKNSIVVQIGDRILGNDWAVFEVFENSETNLMPIEEGAQHKYFTIKQTTNLQTLRVTGYGDDTNEPEKWYRQQSATGPDWGSDGNILKYRVDTEGGNSGSPVIDDLSPAVHPLAGIVVGIY